ncbi:MAG: hypothetical protein ACU841_05870 [Gammaproteobacteria bacterium]
MHPVNAMMKMKVSIAAGLWLAKPRRVLLKWAAADFAVSVFVIGARPDPLADSGFGKK